MVTMDTVRHTVKVVPEASTRKVRHGYTHTLHTWVGGACVAEGGVDDQSDSLPRHKHGIMRSICSTEEQSRSNLRHRHLEEEQEE